MPQQPLLFVLPSTATVTASLHQDSPSSAAGQPPCAVPQQPSVTQRTWSSQACTAAAARDARQAAHPQPLTAACSSARWRPSTRARTACRCLSPAAAAPRQALTHCRAVPLAAAASEQQLRNAV